MVNQEVKSLVMEMKSIKQHHLDAEEELQLAYNRIKQLEDENSDLKTDLETAALNQKRVQDENAVLASRSVPTHQEAPAPVAPVAAPTNSGANGLHTMSNQQQSVNGHHQTQHADHDHAHESDHRGKQEQEEEDDDWNQGRQQVRDSTLVNPNSVIHQDSLMTFRNAIDDLLSAGRYEMIHGHLKYCLLLHLDAIG